MIISLGDYIEGKDKTGTRIGGTVYDIVIDNGLEETFIKLENNGKKYELMGNQVVKLEKAKTFEQLSQEFSLTKDMQIEILRKYIGQENGKLALFTKNYIKNMKTRDED